MGLTPTLVHTRRYATPVGVLLLGDADGRLCLCDWEHSRRHRDNIGRLARCLDATCTPCGSPLLDRAAAQLDEYFAGRRTAFDLPLHLAGTDFQRSVWEALLAVPYGQTVTYSQLARTIGRPTAVRAVAAACGANALSVVVPCHRAVGADGAPTGYAGGLPAKRFLLDMERSGATQRPAPPLPRS